MTDVPAAAPSPSSPTPPVPGNRYRPVSWNDTVRTPGSAAVDRLDAVAVMDVEVDVQHAQAVAPRPRDRERRVVVDAEARGAVAHRVVEPAARVERVLDVAAQDRLHRPQRAAGDRRGGIVHPGERRIVATHADTRLGEPERIAREAPDGLDVAGRMAPLQLVVGGRLRRESRLRADRPEQVQPRAEPSRRQRMPGPEVVVGDRGPKTSSIAWHDSAMERVYTTPLLDKLGIRPGMRVALVDIDDPDIRPRSPPGPRT